MYVWQPGVSNVQTLMSRLYADKSVVVLCCISRFTFRQSVFLWQRKLSSSHHWIKVRNLPNLDKVFNIHLLLLSVGVFVGMSWLLLTAKYIKNISCVLSSGISSALSSFDFRMLWHSFFTLLVGWQVGHLACKNSSPTHLKNLLLWPLNKNMCAPELC